MLTTLLVIFPPLLLLSVVYLNTYYESQRLALLEQLSRTAGAELAVYDQRFYSASMKLRNLTNNPDVVYLLQHDYRDNLLSYMENLDEVMPVMDALRSDDPNTSLNLYSFNETLYRTYGIRWASELRGVEPETIYAYGRKFIPYYVFDLNGSSGKTVKLYDVIHDYSGLLAIAEIAVPVDPLVRQLASRLPQGSLVEYVASAPETEVWLWGEPPPQSSHAPAARAASAQSFAMTSGSAQPAVGADLASSSSDALSAYTRLAISSAAGGGEFVIHVPDRYVRAELARYIWTPALMIGGLLCTIFVSIQLVARLLTRRLGLLMERTKRRLEKGGDLDKAPTFFGADEFGQLDEAFRELLERVKFYYNESAQTELRRKLLETELLHVQVNPHVLYNSLSAIRWVYDDARLHQLIDTMVDYYRLFLNRGHVETRLDDELRMIEKYVHMQQFAYASAFQYECEVEQGLREDAFIMGHLIQPIVENALVHGIRLLESGGKVVLSAERQGELLLVTVRDNGAALYHRHARRPPAGEAGAAETAQTDELDADEEQRLLAARSQSASPVGSGYALHNIQSRLKLYYGERYGVRLERGPGEWTVVTITLPYRTGASS
ncbi:histidine kinase [Paenibacillus sp. IB182496]|uniref:Histidine kinase n=1 Tax=Paenibacillus sabuli TaxID=2772509 RepID=A0A927GT61_9BACL|nr:histidine kinase [Paenibacillus sabuli]MBD2847006.1 histidine kinase [Paenibacillus sabuli]